MDFKRLQDNFWTEYLIRNKRKRNKTYDPNKIILISGNTDKLNELSEVANDRGIKIISRHSGGENAIHVYLKNCIAQNAKRTSSYRQDYSEESYSLDVAWLKVAKIFENERADYKNNPIMASDIVVLQGKEIFEKLKHEEEAIDILMKLSGQEVTVSCGVFLYNKIKSGKEFPLLEGVALTIKLRSFSELDAQQYIDSIESGGKDIKNIAGVIDYSDMAAQELIDKDHAIKIEPLGKEDNDIKSVLISPEILPKLKDYLKGMPKELLEKMLDRQQALEKV